MTHGFRRLAAVLAAEGLVMAALLTLAADIRAHAKVENLGGVNVWGYRGPVAHRRQPNEIRIVIVGGTRAFGWGQPASALPSVIRQIIMATTDRPGRPLRPVVVVNLGRPGALPGTYAATLEHYAYLRPDFVCVYDDLGERRGGTRHSATFELTGYRPILPLVMTEKGMAWRFGTVAAGYDPVSAGSGRSSLEHLSGRALMAAGRALGTLDSVAAQALDARQDDLVESGAAYAGQVVAAVDAAHRRARGVVLVLSPVETPGQRERHDALAGRLVSRRGEPWLRVVDLDGDRALTDPSMRIDGWNYSSTGITRTAARIAPALLDLIATS